MVIWVFLWIPLGLITSFWLYLGWVTLKSWRETKRAQQEPSLREQELAAWSKGPEYYEDWCIGRGMMPRLLWSHRHRNQSLPRRAGH